VGKLIIAITVIVELVLFLLRGIARKIYGISSTEPTVSVAEWNEQPLLWRKFLCGLNVEKGVKRPPKIRDTQSGVL